MNKPLPLGVKRKRPAVMTPNGPVVARRDYKNLRHALYRSRNFSAADRAKITRRIRRLVGAKTPAATNFATGMRQYQAGFTNRQHAAAVPRNSILPIRQR